MTSAKAILLVAALQAAAPAQTGDLTRLFPAKPTGYVTDGAGVLDAGAVQRITGIIERLRSATSTEIAIAVLPTIGDRAPVDVAVAIGRAWGVGPEAPIGDQRRNAGLVILLVPRQPNVPNSGKIFIAPGMGLEGIVTDLKAGQVRDLMFPFLRNGNYSGGLEAGVQALAGIIAEGMGVNDPALRSGARPVVARPPPQRNSLGWIKGFVWIGLLIFVLILNSASRRRGGGSGWGSSLFWLGMLGGGGRGGGGGGGFGGFGGFGGGGFGGFGGGGGFSGGGAGGSF